MSKLVVLKLGEGSLAQGFPVTMQIGEEGARPSVEVIGQLPADPKLAQCYQQWQLAYHQLGLSFRLNAPKRQITNVSLTHDCKQVSQALESRLNDWLKAESFRPVREKWLEQLSPSDRIRVILQTNDLLIQHLPWHLWELLDRYAQAELALSLPTYERIAQPNPTHPKISILAILGNSQGIDIETDRALLSQLPDAEVHFLVEPQRQILTDQLWSKSWDILFFAGHSSSEQDSMPDLTPPTGRIFINATESLTIAELRYALKQAIEKGLKLAIFNSCDGLGLAWQLADLQIPQLIVMREPVPDRVAQIFLKNFLIAFSQGELLYSAVRRAREKLQGIEDRFPCASWLPVICQNPTAIPPTWQSLKAPSNSPPIASPKQDRRARGSFISVAVLSLLTTLAIGGFRFFGGLQALELIALDGLVRSRPTERMDDRILIIGITEEDIQQQKGGKGSLSDNALNPLLERLEQYQPSVIGLDIYRDFPVEPGNTALAERLKQNQKIIAICKSSDVISNHRGVAPPPEVPSDRIGFSDFWDDLDGVVRRQVLFISPDLTSRCTASYAFSTQLAFRYLFTQGIIPEFTPDGDLKLKQTIFKRLQPHTGGYQVLDARGSQILLNYRSTTPVAPVITLEDVLAGRISPDSIKGRIVLIGVTAATTSDSWATPYGSSKMQQLAGVMVQAQMISHLMSAVLDHRPLTWVWHPGVELLWIGAWSLLGGSLVWVGRSLQNRGIALVFVSIGLYGLCLSVFLQAGWIPLVPAALGLWVTSGIVMIEQGRRP